jgi:ParB family chromosome partitioning protein
MATQKVQAQFQPIPVDLIETGPEQARTSKVEEGIEELAESIKRFGLLHPVTVFPKEEKYILLAGQRRLLAVKELGWQEIPAKVLPTAPDSVEAKAVSFSENFMRRDLTRSEKRDACIIFHRRYGSMKAASEALGIPKKEVSEYVKYDRLDDELKKLVDDNTVKLDDAVRAQDISERPDGSIDVEEAKGAALELKTFTVEQKSHLKEIEKEQPTLPPEEKLEEAKKPRKERKYTIILALKYAEGLQKAATEMAKTEEEAAEIFIVEGLSRGGHV